MNPPEILYSATGVRIMNGIKTERAASALMRLVRNHFEEMIRATSRGISIYRTIGDDPADNKSAERAVFSWNESKSNVNPHRSVLILLHTIIDMRRAIPYADDEQKKKLITSIKMLLENCKVLRSGEAQKYSFNVLPITSGEVMNGRTIN